MTDLYDTSPESCGIKERKGQEPAISLRYPSRARAVSYSPFVVFLVLKHKRFHKGVNYGDNFCRRHCRRISFIWTAARAPVVVAAAAAARRWYRVSRLQRYY